MTRIIGEEIRKARKAKRLTQQELANKVNMSRTYLADVERNIYMPSVKKISSLIK